jgi:hypothetical protein
MQMEEPTSTGKNLLPVVIEWYINLHKMLSLKSACRKCLVLYCLQKKVGLQNELSDL